MMVDTNNLRRNRLRRAGRDFSKARDGASAIEFAILSPFFFGALFMMVQASLILFQQHLLDSATAAAIRGLVLGKVQSAGGATVEEFKTTYLCPNLTNLFDCSRVIADVRVTPDNAPKFATSWSDIPLSAQASASYCVGSAGEYMYLRIAYPMPLIGTGLLPSGIFSSFQGAEVAMLESFGALRVEPVAVKRVGTC